MRATAIFAAAVIGSLACGNACAWDSLGGFDRPYDGAGSRFGQGYWGPDGQGLAIAPPPGGPAFGSGFWAAELAARERGVEDRFLGPVAGPAVVALRDDDVVVILPPPPQGFKLSNVVGGAAALSASCVDRKGRRTAAIKSSPYDPLSDGFSGEAFRCQGHGRLEVTTAADLPGLAPGARRVACAAGEAFVRDAAGFACEPKIRLSAAAERALARRYGEASARPRPRWTSRA